MMLFEIECGALYRPAVEIVPVRVLPPLVPFTCQVKAVLAWPLMVAENCCVLKTSTETAAGDTTTTPVDPLVTVTVAEPLFVVFALDVAVTVTCGGVGTVEGAVYTPAVVIVPPPTTLHVTAVFEVPATVAVNV